MQGKIVSLYILVFKTVILSIDGWAAFKRTCVQVTKSIICCLDILFPQAKEVLSRLTECVQPEMYFEMPQCMICEKNKEGYFNVGAVFLCEFPEDAAEDSERPPRSSSRPGHNVTERDMTDNRRTDRKFTCARTHTHLRHM